MLEKMMAYGYPPSVNKFRPEQIAQISTWDGIEDANKGTASMTRITVVPDGYSTITYVNPLDTGDQLMTWRAAPHSFAPLIPAVSPQKLIGTWRRG